MIFPGLADSSAAALEMIHCASLVHDDLPCFDNAATRRGQPSVHSKFGEPMAVLVGDSLIANAFGVIAESAQKDAVRAVAADLSPIKIYWISKWDLCWPGVGSRG
jgi:geranylgeranyl diphosphate synthase type II